jgi:aryl-alcohol dehydrogenase-like predicted oxidoreductase
MRYRRLGKTELRVSVVGFGSWQLGGEWGTTFTPEEAASLISRAHERGINLIDTAECYGDGLSEELIGRAIAGKRGEFVIATKFGHHYDGLFERTPRWRAEEVIGQLEASLRNLRTDYIDLYQAHSPRDEPIANEALWNALSKQVSAGKVRHLGLSIWNNNALEHVEAASRLGIEAVQVVYNRLDRAPEKRLFASCERQDLGVLARVPLASGFLSGKFRPGAKTSFSPDEVRGRWFTQQEVDKKIAEVDEIRRTEVPPGVDMASWSLAFCLNHPAVTCVIPGMKTMAQVDSNAAAADLVSPHPQDRARDAKK